jgi:hypothetical protein
LPAVPPEYDASRATYALTRQTDPQIALAVERALGDARTLACAGHYESPERECAGGRPASLADGSVDAAVGIMVPDLGTLTHLRRVARGQVVLFAYDPERAADLWFVRDYLPGLVEVQLARFPRILDQAAAIGGAQSIERVPIPHDCRDGLLGAFWRRPDRYLDPDSPLFAGLDPEVVGQALDKLRNDLDSRAWRRRYGGLLSRERLDVGYRLVVAER